MNQITDVTTIIGQIGRDADCKQVGNTFNHAIKFPVAINQSWKDANGKEHEQTKWYTCVLWVSEKNTHLKSYFQKGSLIMVKGEALCNAWINKDGELQSQLELRVNEWKVLRKAAQSKTTQSDPWSLGDGC